MLLDSLSDRILQILTLFATNLREYVLPNGSTRFTGHVKEGTGNLDEDQTLKMNNERICVPEVIFSPSDIGSNRQFFALRTVCHSFMILPFCALCGLSFPYLLPEQLTPTPICRLGLSVTDCGFVGCLQESTSLVWLLVLWKQ